MLRSSFLLLALANVLPAAEPALEVVQPTISQSDGGTPLPAGFAHAPGEALFFTFQVAGFRKSPEDKVRMEIPIPPLAGSGAYRVVVKVRDEIAKTEAEKTIGFQVEGHPVEPSDALVVRNFRFFRGEDDQAALPRAVYRPGDAVWARFDIIGYKYGKNNAVDVAYGIAVLSSPGKVLWSQNDAAVERSESFYPKRYVPGAMSINLQPTIRPGEYTIAVQVRDATGNQTFEGKYNFNVQP